VSFRTCLTIVAEISPSTRKLEGNRGTLREGSNWIFRYGLQGQLALPKSWHKQLTDSETLCDASVLVRYPDILWSSTRTPS